MASPLASGIQLVQAMSTGDALTVNALAVRLDTNPRLARMVLYEAHSRGLVEPTPDLVTWVRVADGTDAA
jgi:hypothetical protein